MFFSILKRSIKDVNDYCSVLSRDDLIANGRYKKSADVVWGDLHKRLNTDVKFNLLVTSPPYGDNQTTVTYGQFSFLPLQWIPSEDIDPNIEFNYLKTTTEIDSNSLGGRIIPNFQETQETLFNVSPTLKRLFDRFNDEEKKRAKKIVNFFHDLDKSIETMMTKLHKGADNVSFLVGI